MVLELKIPHRTDLRALTRMLPVRPTSKLAAVVGRDLKGKISPVLYALAIPLAFIREWIADAIDVGVALMWFVPDRRIEERLRE